MRVPTPKHPALAATALLALSLTGEAPASDAAWFKLDPSLRKPSHTGVEFVTSQHVTMRDGAKISIDLYLPEGLKAGERVPTLLWITRYVRSMQLRAAWRWLFGNRPFDHTGRYGKIRRWFVTHGYAWVDMDVRGTGASSGHQLCPYAPDEIRDYAEVVDWIVAQPWSSRKVGALGVSYSGSTAEFLLLNHHPTVKAVAPLFASFDSYADIAFPGGIHGFQFTRDWQRMNDALDRNAPHEIAGSWIRLFVTGTSPVAADTDGRLLAAALRDHSQNFKVHDEAVGLPFRDDMSPNDPRLSGGAWGVESLARPLDPEGTLGMFSPHNYRDALRSSGAAIYSYSGWVDGAYAHAAIKRFLTLGNPGSRLTLGPGNHGGGWAFDPLTGSKKSEFDHLGELLRFFDRHLKGVETGIEGEKPIHYFTMGEDAWKESDTWPPAGANSLTLYVATDHALSHSPPSDPAAADSYTVDLTAGTGPKSRYRNQTQLDRPVEYPDRATRDRKLLFYQSKPLESDLEVTGHPLVTLFVDSTTDDGQFHVYLEDVDPAGRVGHVTQGQLRALHRRLSAQEPPYKQVVPYRTYKKKDALPLVPGEIAELIFDLLPTSYLFRKGHSIRLALAGADADHFVLPPGPPPTIRLHRSFMYSSRILLPTIPR